MRRIRKANKKPVAAFFLLLFIVESFYPAAAYALTSGPSQPEMQKFHPAGVSDMVDMFSGDFKYDIPLMDVGGYPINISYHSGNIIEDESTWVGAGWSLNPGVVNRSMRGLPDDFTGTVPATDQKDMIKVTNHRKPFTKVGGQLTIKPSLFGWEVGAVSLHLNVYKDSYWGIGGGIGASLNYDLAQCDATTLTAGLNLNSDPREGVSVSPSLSVSTKYDDTKEINQTGLTGGFTYNTRAGLQQVSLGTSFSLNSTTWDDDGSPVSTHESNFSGMSFTKYFGHTYTPGYSANSASSNGTFSVDFGPQVFGIYAGIGGQGYVYKQWNPDQDQTIPVPAYGYMNYAQGKNNTNAMLDFNREKDGVFMPNTPVIAIPVSTEDYFEATNQSGSQQFRPYYNGNYTVFDRTFTNVSKTLGAGLTIGAGNTFQGGARIEASSGKGITQKWTNGNGYLSIAEPAPAGPGKDLPENIYFKKSGEQTAMDSAFYQTIGNDVTQRASLEDCSLFGGNAVATSCPVFRTATGTLGGLPIQRYRRDIRTNTFSYLTATQASQYGLDKNIISQKGDAITPQPRVDNPAVDPTMTVHKAHHISEITVTDHEGKRMVYGIPVYNTDHEEVSFSLTKPSLAVPLQFRIHPEYSLTFYDYARKYGLANYTPGTDNSISNANGRENIFSKKVIPPYATSYLLTGILSPDYVDLKGDGITDDDLGTAVKFSYFKLPSSYKWRAPYGANMANYNEGFLTDVKDDKANYVWGQKEVWYLNSVGSKTMVAKFFTSNRADALGVVDENGAPDPSVRLQKLDSIQLFSKADIFKNGSNAIPIKVVHFVYDYSLVPFVPNNSQESIPVSSTDPTNLNASQGKLTLRQIYFTFGTSSRGQSNPYLFSYDMRLIRDGSIANLPVNSKSLPPPPPFHVGPSAVFFQDPVEANDRYLPRETDRWGTYKQSFYTHNLTGLPQMNNSEFPYSQQVTDFGSYDERQLADRLASKWQLNSITTPTGGIISVEYESDDYSYVQDRKAMEMCSMAGLDAAGDSSGMTGAGKLYVTVPVGVTSQADFANTYLSGPNGQEWNNIFYKIYTDVDNKGDYEFIYGYAEIDPTPSAFDMVPDAGNPGVCHKIGIPVKMVNGYNPVSKQAWQTLQTDLPQYAYANYDNSDVSSFAGDVQAAVRSIVQSFADLRELFQSFDKTASGKHFGDRIQPSRSLIRLNAPIGKTNGGVYPKHTYGKLGGGARVRKVEISDEWDHMTGIAGVKRAAYGIQYDYTMTDDNGNLISSGVASYEPEIGNEENPFHEPVNYTEKVQWGLDKYHFMEKPFGESYFPAPSVGYSQVKATDYGVDHSTGSDMLPHTNSGYTIDQFYTARDFPTQVDYLPLDQHNQENDLSLMLFVSTYSDKVTTSQGFKVELNDMHGKQKAVQVFDNSGALLSSTEYFYNLNDENAQQKTLNNTVLAMKVNGTIPQAGELLGTDADLVTDTRESNSNTVGASIAGYIGETQMAIFPFPFGSFTFNANTDTRTYNSISSVKVIHQYGILKATRTTQNGSTLTGTNLLWDAQTGDVLLTQNQNEYNDYTYSFHYPAYLTQDGMSGAYKNIGGLLTGLVTNSDGTLSSTGYTPYLAGGDELVDIDPGSAIRGWIITDKNDGSLRLIDAAGNFIAANGNYLIVRSGRRNLLAASAGALISITNPLVLVNGIYELHPGVDKKILDAKVVTYKDEWAMPVPNVASNSGPQCGNPDNTKFSPGAFTVAQRGTPPVSCNDMTFQAGSIGNIVAAPFRGYTYFSRVNFPTGAVVQSATISLIANTTGTSTPTIGANACFIKRVTPNVLCGNAPAPTWTSPPSTTEVGKVSLPASSSPVQNYPNIDVTTMYNDFLAKGDPIFEISIMLQDETSTGTRQMIFYGSDVQNGSNALQLTVCYTTPVQCLDPVSQPINPYYQDVKGVWRADSNFSYVVNRVQTADAPSLKGGTNIRSSGYYSEFTPFWAFTATSLDNPVTVVDNSGADPNQRWTFSDRPVYFDQKGNAVENVDALKRYTSDLFGYDQSLVTAAASNARHNEIAFDGFEDYNFGLEQVAPGVCPPVPRQLDLGLTASGGQFCSGGNCIVPGISHSGNYSLQLNSALTISRPQGQPDAPSGSPISFDASGHCILLTNQQAAGFAPVGTKKYLFSVWVNDNSPDQATIQGLTVNINGVPMDISNLAVPVVEGWKKLDLTLPGTAFNDLQISGTGLYIDDLRILPLDGQLRSWVYDENSLRMTAQLDENNFATFFEYDDEGNPIRVKKETEKGIMTIKENRQSIRKSR